MNLSSPMPLGYRISGYGFSADHPAYDIVPEYGVENDRCYPLLSGVVTFAGLDDRPDLLAHPQWNRGLYIMVDHADGVVSRYVHASKLLVKKGQVVDAQTPLGYMGDTGAAHGKHWHIGLENHGMAVDWVPRLNEQENTVTRIPGQQDLINFIRVKREQRSEELKADIRQAQERLEALGRIEEQWPV